VKVKTKIQVQKPPDYMLRMQATSLSLRLFTSYKKQTPIRDGESDALMNTARKEAEKAANRRK